MSALKEEDFKDRNEKSNSSISYIIDFKEEEKKKKLIILNPYIIIHFFYTSISHFHRKIY